MNHQKPLTREVKASGEDEETPCTCRCKVHHPARSYFPEGYRFMPKDDELITHYLERKINDEPIPVNEMSVVNLYLNNPQDLAEEHPHLGEDEWYFFTPRDRKYPNGSRPNRAAGDGYWKATGADRPIDRIVHGKTQTIGFRKVLVFYEGKPPRGDKTDWIMHEFRGNQPPRDKTDAKDMRLDDWVLCRVYKKTVKPNNKNQEEGEKGNSTNHVDHHDHENNPSTNNRVGHFYETINPLDQAPLMGAEEHSLVEAVEPKEEISAADNNNNINTAIHEHHNNVGLSNNYGDLNQVVFHEDYDTCSLNLSHRMGYGYGAVNLHDQSPFNSAQFLLNENCVPHWSYNQTFEDLDNWGVESYHHQGFQHEHSSNLGPSSPIGNTVSDTTNNLTENEDDDVRTRNLKTEDSWNGGLEEKPDHDHQFDGQLRPMKKRRHE